MITVPMEVSVSNVSYDMEVDVNQPIEMGIDFEVVMAMPFEGEYEYTPSEQTQTIEISGKKAIENIVINPIPNNYGLITWDGTTLTVS